MPGVVKAVLLIIFFLYAAAFSARVHTLEILIEDAYATSHELRAIEQELQKADAQVNEAMGMAFPTISTSVNFSHSIKQYNPFSQSSSSDPFSLVDTLGSYGISPYDTLGRGLYTLAGTLDHLFDALNSMAGDQRKNALSLSLNVTQSIYAQGKIGIGLRISKTYQSMLVCKYQESKLRIKGNVINAFYASLIARKNLEMHQQSLELLEKTHSISVLRLSLGSASELDTLSTRLYVESARADLFKAQSDLRLAHETLILQAGLTVSPQRFVLEGEIPDTPFDLTLSQAVARMHSRSYTINKLRGSTRIADEMVNMARSDFKPLVFAGASLSKIGQFVGFGDVDLGHNWHDDQKLYVGMSWTIFSGMQRSQKLRQAEMERSISYLQKQQMIDNLELAVKSAYEQVITNQNRMEAMRSVMALAQKGYELSARAYEVGQRSLIEMRNAELEVSRALSAYNAVQYAYLRAITELRVLMGDL